MPTAPGFETVPDDVLLASVRTLVARTNTALAELLAHLAEVEARGIHRQRACASLYTYWVYELRMSEDEAYRRAKAARLVRAYPEVYERIACGELHLTGLLLLAPHLDCERRREILDFARFRSKREIQELVARLDPKPEVPALVEPIVRLRRARRHMPASSQRSPDPFERCRKASGPRTGLRTPAKRLPASKRRAIGFRTMAAAQTRRSRPPSSHHTNSWLRLHPGCHPRGSRSSSPPASSTSIP